jgi:hypothetical protein
MLSLQMLSGTLGMASRCRATRLLCATPVSRISVSRISLKASTRAVTSIPFVISPILTIATIQPTAGGIYGDESRPD